MRSIRSKKARKEKYYWSTEKIWGYPGFIAKGPTIKVGVGRSYDSNGGWKVG